MAKSLKQRLTFLLAQPGVIRWAAPFRTLRQLCGWRPYNISVHEARNILVIRPDEIGDVVLTSPFLRELRRAAPQAEITLLVKAACRELMENCPYVDSNYALNFAPHLENFGHRLRLCWRACLLRWTKIGLRGFDLVLLPRRGADQYDSILIGHLLAGHGALIIHDENVVKNTIKAPIAPPVAIVHFSNPQIEHEVLHNLRFLSACGVEITADSHLEIWLTDSDCAFARGWLAENFSRVAPLVLLHPSGGRSPLKQWPRKNFRELLDRLLIETNFDFLIIGGDDEEWITRDFIAEETNRVAVAVGKFKLRQLAAIMERSQLFIGGDSGPMHLAAAVGTRVLAVFGSTSETRFRPWGANCRVVSQHYECSPDILGTYEDRCPSCRFQEPRCLTELPVKAVLTEALKFLEEHSVFITNDANCEG